MVLEDLAVDADHPQVQLAHRPAEKRPQALGRQRHEPTRHRALLDVPRSVTSAGAGSNVPAYRRVDTPAATADSVCSSSGSVAATHWKLGSPTFTLRAPHP